MKKFIPLLFLLASCFSTEGRTEVCKASSITYNDVGLVKVGTENAGQFTSELDISDQIEKLKKYGEISIYVSKAQIDSLGDDLTWVGSIRIDLVARNGDRILLSESVISGKQREIKLNVNQSVDLYPYFSTGEVKLVYTVKGEVPASFRANNNLCFSINTDTSKDLSDIK